MSQPLPRLRMNLDFMPSPVEDRPGLLIRDNYGYSDAILIIPPQLVACLQCFDGEQTEADLRAALVRITGDLDVSSIISHLRDTLRAAGFLQDEVYEQLRESRHRAFAESDIREPSHAGAAYPEDANEARTLFAKYLSGGVQSNDGARLRGIAAPHVSPFGGWQSYRAAYSVLGEEHRDRTFVILGTSHYGEPDRFGLTRKRFVTPFGETQTDLRLLEELASEPAANMEDYCHSVEHSIEFQVVFLQHIFGPDIRILPILCGSFVQSICGGGLPEANEKVRRFLDRLREMNERNGSKLLWVLGIDMAHMGTRYGDLLPAMANEGEMQEVLQRDHQRLERVNASDAEGFWNLIQQNQDDLKWCGSAPLYTFLRAVPGATGNLRSYEQWNIDERSVVSFAGIEFQQ